MTEQQTSHETATTHRTATISRTTSESSVELTVDLDGTGRADVSTGVRFYDHMLISIAKHSLIDLTVKATGDLDVDQFGVGAEYKMANGVGLSGFWRRVAYDTPADEFSADAVGLGASYDLGGGATIKGGIVNVSGDDALGSNFADRTMADFGLAFKF